MFKYLSADPAIGEQRLDQPRCGVEAFAQRILPGACHEHNVFAVATMNDVVTLLGAGNNFSGVPEHVCDADFSDGHGGSDCRDGKARVKPGDLEVLNSPSPSQNALCIWTFRVCPGR